MERAGGDEQNMIGAHHAIARIDRRALDDRQNVALHTLARDVRAVAGFAAGNLIDLVEKDYAGRFDALQRCARHRVHVDEPLFLFLHQIIHRFVDAHLAPLAAPLKKIAEHVFMLMPISSTPIGPASSIVGKFFSRTSISTRRLSSLPERNWVRSFSRVRAKFSSRDSASGTKTGALVSPESKSKIGAVEDDFGGGSRISSTRSSTFSSALSAISSIFSWRVMSTAISVRSRIMLSTSRPT